METRKGLNGGFQLTSEEAEKLMRATAPVPHRPDGFYLDTRKPILARIKRFILG